ncbi:MAG TPA: hypothetical protein VGP72_24605 [Planctomycetota bacterium]|jgi:type II secretory pathway pseudopilin PulG
MNGTLLFPVRNGVRRYGRPSGFSLIEVLFAIGMLGMGIVGVLALFTTGISAAAWSGNMTSAAMEAQTLYTKVLAESDANGKRIYLAKIQDPDNPVPWEKTPIRKWIHGETETEEPTQILSALTKQVEDPELWWRCRVSRFPMSKEDPMDPAKDVKTLTEALPAGLFQIAIAVYRNPAGRIEAPAKNNPVAIYTTYVTAGY